MKRVSKREWLDAALEALEAGGIDGVSVKNLAKELGIARSGFYWHFEDRAELLREILAFWRNEFTEIVIKKISAMNAKPEARLAAATDMIATEELTRYDIAVREWAKHDLTARATVSEVNKIRLDFVRAIFADMGFKGDDLEMRTMLFVCYHSFEAPMFFDMPQSKLRRLRKRRLKFLTSRPKCGSRTGDARS